MHTFQSIELPFRTDLVVLLRHIATLSGELFIGRHWILELVEYDTIPWIDNYPAMLHYVAEHAGRVVSDNAAMFIGHNIIRAAAVITNEDEVRCGLIREEHKIEDMAALWTCDSCELVIDYGTKCTVFSESTTLLDGVKMCFDRHIRIYE